MTQYEKTYIYIRVPEPQAMSQVINIGRLSLPPAGLPREAAVNVTPPLLGGGGSLGQMIAPLMSVIMSLLGVKTQLQVQKAYLEMYKQLMEMQMSMVRDILNMVLSGVREIAGGLALGR